MTNFNFLLNNLSYLSSEELVVRPMDSTCFRSAPVPPSFRLRLHPLRMVATLLLLLCLGVGNVWGAIALSSSDVTLNSFSSIGGSGYQNSANYTISGYSGFSFSDCMLSSSQLQLKASSGSLTSPTITSSNGFDIEVTYTSDANMTISAGGSSQTAASVLKLSVSSTSTTFTLSTGNRYAKVSSIVLKPKAAPAVAHTVTFTKTDGSTQEITETSVGAGVTPPVMSTPCDGWTFQGWSKSQSTSSTSTTVLTTETLTAGKYYPSANTTLYPVYTKAGTIEQEVSDEITQSTTGLCTGGKGCSSGYTSWSNKSDESDAVYAGQSNAGVAFLQLRNSSPSGIISTSSGGVLKKVIVAWKTSGTPSNTTGRYVTIFGKTSAYSGCANLYDNSKKGTSLGNITYGTSTELDNLNEDNDYGYVGILASAAVYINTITITWLVEEDVTYYYSYPSCCTPLGTINGSVSWSNGQATVSWDAAAGCSSWTLKYKAHTASDIPANWTTYSGAFGTEAGRTSNSIAISGLTAGMEYDFKITGSSDGTTYCAGEVGETTSSTVPQIIASGDLTGSDYAYNDGSGTVKTFDVSGVGLVAGSLTFSVPTSPAQLFEISTDNGVSWGSSKTLAISAGTLSTTTIKVRLKAGFSIGSYGPHTITISGGGAANNTGVTIAGSVTSACTEPTVETPTLASIASGTITPSCASVTVDENCDVTEYGFVWNESSDPTISDNKTPVGSSTPASGFNDNLSISFTTGTTYKIKAYAINSAGTTLSATLSVTPQSVTFVSNGGSSVATAYVNNGGTVRKPSNPSLANYDFDNWYTDDKTFVSVVDFSSAITEDKTYYANWTETLHDVTVEYKCGSTTVKTSTTIENVGVVTTGSTTAPNDITGYTWSSWSAMPSGVTTSTTPLTTRDITINATADGKTITANYTANQYDITYKDEGDAAYSGDNEGSLPSIHTYGSATALIDGTKTGYDFVGWFTDAACTESAGASIGATAKTVAFTLYAKWTAKEYDVTLKANGGSSSDQVVSATYDAAMPATVKAGTGIVAPTYNGYTFGGYYDNADYTMGTQYYTDALASAHNWDKASTANLYGHWIPNEYVVTLDANGGVDGATTSVNTTFGQAMPTIATANLPTRAGYRFDGFYMGKTDGTKYYNADGTSAKNQARHSDGQVLYAHWVAQLKFSVNGVIDDELTRDDNTAMPSTATVPTACGDCWAFMGWSTDPDEDGSGTIYAGGATHEFGEPTTLYAVFGKAEYKMINSTSDLIANDNYILTFYYDATNHEYALSNEKAYTYDAAVTDVTSLVRENGEGWFIYNIGANNIWKFTGTKDAGQLYNAASDKYVNLSSTGSDLLNTTDNLTFTNDGIFWTIKSTNYLKPYSYSSYEISSSEPSYSAFLYHQISAEYATEPSCETYDIVWKVNGTPLSSGSQTEETNECTGIEDLPANPEDDALDCATKFMGWSEQELVGESHDAPADLFTAIEDAPIINEDKTFHAVFATGTPIANKYVLGSVDDLKDGQKVILVNHTNSVACTSTANATSGALNKIDISSSLSDGVLTTSESSIIWTVTKSGDYYIFKQGDNYLRATGNSSLYCDGTSDKWTITDGSVSGTYYLTSYNGSTKFEYYSSKSYFTTYSGTGALYNTDFYIPAESYSDYMTECCEHIVTLSDGSPANGTVTFDPAGSVETCTGAKEVSMTITPNPGYYLSGWTSSGVAPTSVVPAVVTNTADAQTTTLTFAEGSVNGTYTTGATFTAKALEGWTWMYKKDADVADNSVDPYAIPDVVELYKDQYARFIITGYAPADVIAEKQGYLYSAGGVEPDYTTGYLTWVANTASYFTLKGKNPVESTTITFKAIGDASITRTMTIRVKALPLVHFVDNVHNVAFDDVVATVETGVVTLTKQTPTQDDFDGSTKNTCEETHLHLVGWIDGDWTPYQAYMNGTGKKPTVSAIIGATGYFYAPNVDIDLVAKDGKTFYAVWANVE